MSSFLLLKAGSSFSSRFAPEVYQTPGALVTSNRMRPSPLPAAGAAVTIPTGCSVTFDGITWLTGSTTWPAGAKWIQAKAPDSGSYGTQVDNTFVFGGVNYVFLISTKVGWLNYLVGDGTGYLQYVNIIGTETVANKEGTATVTISAGRIDVGVGTLWNLVLSNGSHYECPVDIGGGYGIFWDVSGNGRHLLMRYFVDLSAACVETATSGIGSFWMNDHGYTEVIGGDKFYISPVSYGLVPVGVKIPALADKTGCCAYEVLP